MNPQGTTGRPQVLAMALAVTSALGATVSADEPGTARGGTAGTVTQVRQRAREVAEIRAAFRDLAEALRDDDANGPDKGGSEALFKAIGRPERVIEPPTLTPFELDTLIDTALATAQVPPAPTTSDEEFARRLYLDVTGKPPTPDQVAQFAQSKEPAKRARLIDALLDSPDYAANWARYWRDVISYRATVVNARLINFPKLEEWLRDQFAANRPWDEIARDLITATGRTDEYGATVFTAAHMAQPVEVAGEVSRVFLGVQVQCAECHDHPTDPWTREQFHQFAAFFAGTRARRNGKTQGLEVTATVRPRYGMPDLKDPKKTIPIEPRFFLATTEQPIPKRLTAQQRRELAASYVTGQDNPWFARAIVNRAWYALMGDGFYNPIDDLGPTREATNPEVLEALATQFQQGGYDVKWLFQTILNTRAYQRDIRSTSTAAGRTPFAANCSGRLRSDQIYDALVQAIGFAPPENARRAMGLQQGGPKRGARDPRTAFNLLFGADPSTPNEEVLGTIPQALFLMNSVQVNAAIAGRRAALLPEILSATDDNREALKTLYLRVLARGPTPEEARLCARYLREVGDRREAFEDILWSLVNSAEFVSRR